MKNPNHKMGDKTMISKALQSQHNPTFMTLYGGKGKIKDRKQFPTSYSTEMSPIIHTPCV